MTQRKPELYKTIPSDWSDFFPLYDEAVATAPRGSILIVVGSFWGKSAVYLAEAAKLADKDLRAKLGDTEVAMLTDEQYFEKTAKMVAEYDEEFKEHGTDRLTLDYRLFLKP